MTREHPFPAPPSRSKTGVRGVPKGSHDRFLLILIDEGVQQIVWLWGQFTFKHSRGMWPHCHNTQHVLPYCGRVRRFAPVFLFAPPQQKFGPKN